LRSTFLSRYREDGIGIRAGARPRANPHVSKRPDRPSPGKPSRSTVACVWRNCVVRVVCRVACESRDRTFHVANSGGRVINVCRIIAVSFGSLRFSSGNVILDGTRLRGQELSCVLVGPGIRRDWRGAANRRVSREISGLGWLTAESSAIPAVSW
jgi:hypothetical protein